MNWNRAQVLAALHLYVQLPFGQLHHRNPRIQQLARWLGRTDSAVAMKLCNLASLDPQIVASGRRGLEGASRLDQQVWAELQANWDAVATAAAAAYEAFAAQAGLTPLQADGLDEADLLMPDSELAPAQGKERLAVVQQRLNQARFRRAVLASYGGRCCITGLSEPRLLVASHIVPWAVDTENRLNPRNGLSLSALHDRAFDQGLITVTPGEHRIKLHPDLPERADDPYLRDALLVWAGQPLREPERFAPHDAFLDWHGRHFGVA